MPIIDEELQKYLPQILEQSKNGIVISDPNQKNNPVIFVNQMTIKTFGYERSDFIGRNCGFLQKDDTQQIQIKQISQAIKKRKAITTTIKNYKKNGQLVYNELTISPIFDKQKNLKYFLGIQKDVTKETLLKHQNKTLEQERLIDAQFNAIGKLSAGISHEINTPLTVINGNIEMLKLSIESLGDVAEKKYMQEDLKLIQSNLNRIRHITESIREVADTDQFAIANINLFRALIISLRLTHHKAKKITKIKIQNNIFDMDIDRDEKNYMIDADRRKLEQAFIAIIDNALDQLELKKSYDDNYLNITINELKDKYEVVFEDNAGGIDPKLLPNIFKPFKNTKKHRGLGIGLSMVKKIIDQHKFDIDVQNYKNGVRVKILVK